MTRSGFPTPVKRGADSGDAHWVDPVINKTTTTPPGSPGVGDRYIVAAVATGAWVGQENNIAEWNGGGWDFTTAIIGLTAYVNAETEYYSYNGSAWVMESFGPHATTHENGGTDEIDVAGLSGELADPQPPKTHATTHDAGGADAMAIDAAVGTGSLRTLGTGAQQACAGNDSRLSDARAPLAHASSHEDGGSDEVQLENLATAAAVGTVPVSDGAGATASLYPAGARVVYPSEDLAAIVNAGSANDCFIAAPGTHTLSGPITLKAGMRLVGCGYATVLVLPSAIAFQIGSTAHYAELGNFSIQCASNQSVIACPFTADYVHIHDIHDRRFPSTWTNPWLTATAAPRVGWTIERIISETDFRSSKFVEITSGSSQDISGIVIRDCRIVKAASEAGALIDINPGTGGSALDCLIADNILSGGSINIDEGVRILIEGNVLRDATDTAILIDADDSVIQGNALEGHTSHCIEVHGSNRLVIDGNTLDGGGDGVGCNFNGCTHLKIVGNVFNVTGQAMDLDNTDQCSITGNSVINANIGIHMRSNGVGWVITGNYLHSTNGNGIQSSNDTTNTATITGNIVISDNLVGITVSGVGHVIDGNIVSAGGDGITVDGDGTNVSHNHITAGSEGILLAGANGGSDSVIGGNYVDAGSAGISITAGAAAISRISVLGNVINDPGGAGVDVESATDVTICGNVVYDAAGDAINMDGDRGNVQGNLIVGGSGKAIEVGDSASPVNNVTVQGNVCYNQASDDGLSIRGYDCTVQGNMIVGAGANGIAVEDSGDHCVVQGNVVDGCQNAGILSNRPFTAINGNLVQGAGAAGTGAMAAVRCESTDCTIQGNSLAQDAAATAACIDLSGSDRCSCVGNLITDAGDHGIWANDLDYASIASNVIISPADRGITVEGTGDCVAVLANVIYNTGNEGIYVASSAQNISMEGNIIHLAGSDGIEVDGSQCQLIGNMIHAASNYGIYIKGVECQVQANYMQDCGNIGLDTDATADRCQMVCNFILNAENRGIDIDGDNNHLWANYIIGDAGTDESLIDCGGAECQIVMNFLSGSSSQNGIHVEGGSDRTLVEGNMLDGVGGDSIYVNDAEDVSVIGNLVIGAADEAIYSDGTSHRTLIVGNMVYDPTGSGIEVDGNAATVEGNHVYSAGANGIDVGTGDYVQVIGNMVYDPVSIGIYVGSGALRGQCLNNYVLSAGSDGIQSNGQFWQINGNYINGTGGDGIDVNNSYHQINDNWIYNTNTTGITVISAAFAQVCNNRIQTTGGHGIVLSGSNSSTVRGNHIVDVNGTTQDGVNINSSDYCTVDGNYIVDPTGSGITVTTSDNGIVSNNYVQNAAEDGIDLNTVTEFAVNGNRCESCALYGIDEDSNCDYNLFGVNHLRGNTTGGASFNGTNRTESGNKVA